MIYFETTTHGNLTASYVLTAFNRNKRYTALGRLTFKL